VILQYHTMYHTRILKVQLFVLAALLVSILPLNAIADYTPGAPGCESCPENISVSECKEIACPSEYESCGLVMDGNNVIEDFDWSGVGQGVVESIDYEFTKVWNAKTLSGPTTHYFPSNKSPVTIDGIKQYVFERYSVELTHVETNEIAVFDANICVNPPNGYINLEQMLTDVFEKWPKKYIYALEIVSSNGRGIQFFHNSYVGGAYGGKDYIDAGGSNLGMLMHESGHTMEQHRRLEHQGGDTQLLNPIWIRAIQCDSIRTSGYGNSNFWEDMAEFAKVYSYYMLADELPALEAQSPERFALWKETLCMAEIDYGVGPASCAQTTCTQDDNAPYLRKIQNGNALTGTCGGLAGQPEELQRNFCRNRVLVTPTIGAAQDVCRATCDSCGPCYENDQSRFFMRIKRNGKAKLKTCGWLATRGPQKMNRICNKTASNAGYGPPREVCPKTCGEC